jgi:purine-binding chemotaxis protein CheW
VSTKTAATSEQSQQGQFLTFMLGRESFALGVLGIREIIPYSPPMEVPLAPPHIRGVINLRGVVLPVVDLATRFGREPASVTKRTCIVVVELEADGEEHVLGVVVDAVTAVKKIPVGEIQPAPSFGGSIRADFIVGLGKVDQRFILILSAGRVFDLDEIRVIGERVDAAA